MLQAELKKLNIVDFSEKIRQKDGSSEEISSEIEQDAGLRGDIFRKEDILTSNVFGILKNLDIRVINSVLKEAGSSIILDKGASCDFWSRYHDKTEPDIILQDDENYVVIEVKYLSDFEKGTKEKKPQIIREVEGAKKEGQGKKVEYVAITREENIKWQEKIYTSEENINQIQSYINENLVHHISWKEVLSVLQLCRENASIDSVSQKFIGDLVEYLEFKGIGDIPEPDKQRSMEYFFGAEIGTLEALLAQKQYNLNLDELSSEEKTNLYKAIMDYINFMGSSGKLREISNTVAIEKIPIEVFFGINESEILEWTDFITKLYINDHTNMTGQSDFSIKLQFSVGNYTKQPVSLFTYLRRSRRMTFQQFR
ncbi:MAG: hypothetical protein WCV56_07415 [Candidatus Omnitrophota bacterium]